MWLIPSSPFAPESVGSISDSARAFKSGLAGAADGISSRVDRVRSLGNAVVPQQAAHAFRTLYGEFMR